MEFKIEFGIKEDLCMKAFKKYMCEKYQVENVNAIPISTKKYCNMFDLYSKGWYAREQEIINRLTEK
jgi:hypothetical protein